MGSMILSTATDFFCLKSGLFWRYLLLVLILLLATGLRLTRLGLIEFKFDEATMARSALAVAREGRLPLVGMVSSQGPHNPPLMIYVLALPFAFSFDPRLAAGWTALLGVVAVGLTYWLGRRYFGWRVGVVAALLFAVNPWAVFQSRKIWAQNLPVLTLLFIVALLALVVGRRSWALVGALAAAGGLVSLHLGGLTFFFVLGAVGVLFWRRVRPAPALVGLVVLLLILSPYLIHNAHRGWPDLYAFARLGQAQASFNPRAFWMSSVVSSGWQISSLAGEQHRAFEASIFDLSWLDGAEMALFWIGLVWLGWRVGRRLVYKQRHLSRADEARVVLLIWFLVPVALLTRRSPVHPHDFNLLYPVQHIIVALLTVDVADWIGEWGLWVSRPGLSALVVFFVLLVIWQVYLQESLLTFVDRHETPGGYGAPLKYALSAAEQAQHLARMGGDSEIIALLPGDEPRHEGEAAVFDVLLQRESYRLIDGRKELVVPETSVTYLVHPQVESIALQLGGVADESARPLPLRGGSDASYRFFRRQSDADGLLRARSPGEGPARWSIGPVLLGYDWEGNARPGGTIRWMLIWRVDRTPPAGDAIHWFNHLLDEEGRRWGQKDHAAFPPSKWRAGDTVFSWFDLTVDPAAPDPPYTIHSGLYTYPDVTNIPLVDEAGNPIGVFVELGPIGATP